jgi:REP element-mobilizing transposase RayT
MAGTYTNILTHIIFSTKNRSQIITDVYKNRLFNYIGGIIRNEGAILLEIGGTTDHVHIVIKTKAIHSLATITQKIKSNSSKWVNDTKLIGEKFAWQNGYGAFSVSASQIDKVINYVATQEEHHKKRDFKEELILLLKKHNIEYEEKYLFD